MRLRSILALVMMLALGGATIATTTAQTPVAPPVASPVAGGWQVTETREIAVDGQPVVLSPDGKWLAGTTDDGNAVCAWDVETLDPTCAEVGTPVMPALGYMALRWAPDSSAFAFVPGDRNTLVFGDVMVFEVESAELVTLAGPGDTIEDPLYIGVDWTADSSQVVFAVADVLGDPPAPDALFRVDRGGGDPVGISLPAWSEPYRVFSPPHAVGNDAVLVTVEADGDAAGVWRVPFDGSDPVRLVPATGPDAIPRALVASVSADGRYASVVSLARMMQFETEEVYFIVDLVSGELVPMESGSDMLMVAFAPGGDTGLTVRGDRLATVDPVSGAMQPVANSPDVEPWIMHIPVWAANDTVFLPGDGGGMLIALVPAS